MKTTVLALLISAFAVANTQVREAMADPVKPKTVDGTDEPVTQAAANPVASKLPNLPETSNPDDVEKLRYDLQQILDDLEKQLDQDKPGEVTDVAEGGLPSLKTILHLLKAKIHKAVEDVISKIHLKKHLQQLKNCLKGLKDHLEEIIKKHLPTLKHESETGVAKHYLETISHYLNEIKNEVHKLLQTGLPQDLKERLKECVKGIKEVLQKCGIHDLKCIVEEIKDRVKPLEALVDEAQSKSSSE